MELTKTVCAGCSAPWLGMFWGVDLCNDCRIAELADDQMKHGEFPSDDEIEAMALSASQDYDIAHY